MEDINYDIMRYDLDEQGYILNVYFGCASGTCTGYTGNVPNGYDSLEEWSLEANIRAYKIVSGNLAYDAKRDAELQELYEAEEEENTFATHKWVRGQIGKTETLIIDELSNTIEGSSLVILEESGDYEIPSLTVTSDTVTDPVQIKISNKNLLANKNVSETINGVTFTLNDDKSITLSGTATANIEYVLDGTVTNTDMLFLIKNATDYIVSGLTDDIDLQLYNFDGTDRALVYEGGNGLINLSSSEVITMSLLTIASGKAFSNVTIYPQIEVSSEATSYIEHQENLLQTITLENSAMTIEDELFSYAPSTVVMANKNVNLSAQYFKHKYLSNTLAQIEVNEENIQATVNSINDNIEILDSAINTINETMLTQTAEQFEMLFTQTGIQEAVNELEGALNGNQESLNTITEYIRFEGAEITLGKSNSQTKLVIKNDKISFMTGDVESAYISENTLYITDSTILNKMQIGRWETKEDEYGNLNTKWIGGA